jgi:cobalt-zinc-cadmium efflux system membrane fusion protein
MGAHMNKKWLIWVAAAFLCGVAAGVLLISRRSPAETAARQAEESEPRPGLIRMEPAAQRNIGLRLEQARLRALARTIQATGVVSPNESRLVHVRPLSRGRIEKVFVRLGDRVRAGQTLLIYDNVELGEVIGQFMSGMTALGKAKAEAEVARRSRDRAKALVDVGALAKAEFDRRNAEYNNALASIESQAADLAKTDEKLHRFGLSEEDIQALNPREGAGSHREASHSRMTAPFAGVIISYKAAEGEIFGPDDEVFAIADLSTAWVLADVYEKDIASVRPGPQARVVIDSYPGEVFLGRITYVSDFLDPKTRTAKVRCEVPNGDGRLRLDMFATAELPTAEGRQALMVPSEAVQQVEGREVVFVRVSEAEFAARNVTLGRSSDGWVEVTDGIRPDETVAARGSFYLKSTMLRSQIGGEE